MTRTTMPARIATLALFVVGLMAGCNTTAGVGRDVSAAGQAVTGSAEDNKGY